MELDIRGEAVGEAVAEDVRGDLSVLCLWMEVGVRGGSFSVWWWWWYVNVTAECSMPGRVTNDDQRKRNEVGHDGRWYKGKRGGNVKDGGGY